MTARHLLRDVRVQTALAAFAIALGALVYATLAAVRVDAPRVPGRVDSRFPIPDSRFPIPDSRLSRTDTTSNAILDRAVDRDPFATEQNAAPIREAAQAPVTLASSQPLRLVGTVVDGASGDFALCQLGGDAPKIVRVGQSIGTYTLRSVTQGAASFDSPGGNRLDLRVSKTGS
jgi:hypothetical protein